MIFFFMASVPYALFGLQTKNIHWDTDAIFVQQQSEFPKSDPATNPTAPGLRDAGQSEAEAKGKATYTARINMRRVFQQHRNSTSGTGKIGDLIQRYQPK